MPEEPPTIEKPVEISENPHKLWRQIVGFVFWVGVISSIRLLPNPDSWPGFMFFMLPIGCLTFADAWVSGIYKDGSGWTLVNISPMSWGIGMTLFAIVFFPVYMIMRNKLRTRNGGNGFFIAIAVLGGISIIFFLVGVIFISVMEFRN
ncbi:uncharacterized protein METZ01_LOCUS216165 [marine metagenome]|uniref:Uncharacterized protein n=1 Tax=marine metagenome TaxID=408172 RepID=A0A382FMX1_9ZZZZ